MQIKILIVDSHLIYRSGLKLIIEKNPEFIVTGEVSSPKELFEHIEKNRPDVLLVNKYFPINYLHQIFKSINNEFKEIQTICITKEASESAILEYLKYDVKGILWKESTIENLKEAILTVASGEVFIERPVSRISSKIIEHAHNAHFEESNFKDLTEREFEVLKLFSEGLTYKGIGDVLHISPRTVESHKNHILSKLDLKSVTDMVKYAIKHDLIEL